jgi:Cu(I)/Ag(I) efflux system membrane fusion protein
MPVKTSSRIPIVLGVVLLILVAGVLGYYAWPRVVHWARGHQTGDHEDSMAMSDMPGMETGSASSGTGHGAPAPKLAEKAPGKTLYHCPMHPNYISDKPGACPICNMDLVPFVQEESASSGKEPEGHTSIVLNAERRQLIGVQVGTVEKKRVAKTIRAVGRVEYNEKTLSIVNLKFSGWVEELMVKAVGDPVHKGNPLFSIYSPELLEAQRNYLLARESSLALADKASAANRALGDDATRSARERLLLWDLTDDQIKQIEAKGEPSKRVTIFSKVDGVVTARNIVLGKYVEAGNDLYEIADLSTVWMNADVYEYEIPLIKVGQEARVQLSSMPGGILSGKVGYIYPYLNEQTRTVRVRMEFPNSEGKLKPGMYSTVVLDADLGEQLVVDDGAVLFTGQRNIVFVDKGDGVLEPREVTLGENSEGVTVILSGLSEGEKVVTSGNFLVDSESRLKAALKQGSPPAMGGHEGHTGTKTSGTEPPPGKPEKESVPSMPPGMPGM